MRVSSEKLFNLVACALFTWGLVPAVASAQDCGCDVVVAAIETNVDGAVVPRVGGGTGVDPGDKVCLMAGTTPKNHLLLKNMVGSAAAPLLITNCGGRVIIGPESLALPIAKEHTGVRFQSSRHFVLSGQGDPAHEYGIYIRGTGSGTSGLSLGVKSEYFLVEKLEISHTGFAGIMSKTDPNCGSDANRGLWTQHETYFRDNYIHDVGGEGFYIGSSAYDGYNKDCNGDGVNDTLYPHVTEGVAITGNRVERTDWDGIQLGSATRDAAISRNTVDGFGLEGVYGQSNGIQVGAGTTGWVDRNVVKNGTGNGIFMAGDGENFIVNNLIVRPDGHGIYIGNYGADPGEGFYFYNNTIVGSGRMGLQNFNGDAVGSEAYNNLVLEPGRVVTTDDECFSVASNVDWTPSNNLCADDAAEVAALQLANPAADDYRPQEGSTAIDGGLDLTAAGVGVDLDGVTRPQGAAFDVGAYERSSGAGAVFQQDFQSSTAVASYATATAPSTGQFNDISAEADGGTWSIQQGRLRLVRAGSGTTDNDAGMTRHTDFAGPPAVLHVTFDLGVSAWSASQYQSSAFLLSVGNVSAVSDYGNGDIAVNTFQAMSVNGEGPGRYSFSTAGLESSHFDADGTLHRVALFLNKSGAAASYRAPDGTLRNLRSNGVALWVDSAPVVIDAAATNGSSSALTDLRVRWSQSENATWTLDNWVVRSSFPQ